MKDYNLIESFKKGKLYFAVDAFMYAAVYDMFVNDHDLEPMVSICNPHNWSNASKRTLKDNLAQYWPDGENTVEVKYLLAESQGHGSILRSILYRLT